MKASHKFVLIAVAQTLLLVAATATWFHFRTEAFLAGPGDGDLYAHTSGFQWATYFLVYLPATLVVASGLVALQRSLWLGRSDNSRPGPN